MTSFLSKEAQANAWLLEQIGEHVHHYKQDGDCTALCGDVWGNHTQARDFVTCGRCLAILKDRYNGTVPEVREVRQRDGHAQLPRGSLRGPYQVRGHQETGGTGGTGPFAEARRRWYGPRGSA